MFGRGQAHFRRGLVTIQGLCGYLEAIYLDKFSVLPVL
jgi:hypothetical protein